MMKKVVKKDRDAKVLLLEYANSVLQLAQAVNYRNARDGVGLLKTNLHTLERDVSRLSDR